MNPQDFIPLLTGTASGLVISCIANWYQAKEKREFQRIIAGKDDDLKGLTRDSIAGITTLATMNQQNQKWQDATTTTLQSIEKKIS